MNEKQLRKIKLEDIILEETEDLIAINKPPFISTLEDRNDPYNILKIVRSSYSKASACHRLDKETSGVLILSKNEEFYRHMSSMFENREVNKLYHTVVEGRHEIDEAELDKPIYSSQSRSRIDFEQGKPSVTLIKTQDIYKHHSLLACMPFTGRMHQIRVHLADESMPIIMDSMYGGNPIFLSEIKRNYKIGRNKKEQPLIGRIALHAFSISFPLKNGKMINIKAPYPKDFAVLIKQLEKNKL